MPPLTHIHASEAARTTAGRGATDAMQKVCGATGLFIIVLALLAVLTLTGGCTKHGRNELLAARLAYEIVDEGFTNVE